MAFIEVKAEFKQIVTLLARIADALERAYPPLPTEQVQPIEPSDIHRITDESLWLKEQEEEERRQAGQRKSS